MIGLSYCLYFLPAISSLQSMSSLESLFPVKLTLSNFTNLRKYLSVELSNPDMAMLAQTARLHLHSCYISLLVLGLELITTVLLAKQTKKQCKQSMVFSFGSKMWVTLIILIERLKWLSQIWDCIRSFINADVSHRPKLYFCFTIDLVISKCDLIIYPLFPNTLLVPPILIFVKFTDSFFHFWNFLPCFQRLIVFFTSWKQWVPKYCLTCIIPANLWHNCPYFLEILFIFPFIGSSLLSLKLTSSSLCDYNLFGGTFYMSLL